MLLVFRSQIAQLIFPARHADGLLFKSLIDFKETIIDWSFGLVKNHFDNAEPFDQRVKPGPVSFFRFPAAPFQPAV